MNMRARTASTRKDLVNTRYVKVRSTYVGDNVINLDMEYGHDIVILMYNHKLLDIDGQVFYHNGTKNSFEVLKNKLSILFALENL